MADEMMRKHYDLPEIINETSIRDAHRRAEMLEDYATNIMFNTEESKDLGYLEVEVFTPGASQHTVEPLDAGNVSW